MRKIAILFAIALAAVLSMGGCQVETGTSYGLEVENAILALEGPDGTLYPAESNVFKRGQKINMVLLNVGPFKKGSDGKNWVDIDVEVKGPQGEIVLSKRGLLGDAGRDVLPNDIAESPYGSFATSEVLDKGEYMMTVTIFDKVDGSSASKTMSVILE
ncbi:hypothetical protein J4457_06520 [Candidatus Woesearchaeota archaeon]|nr:hypothetical protein [Candidatus Woesearchaeota archaeon]